MNRLVRFFILLELTLAILANGVSAVLMLAQQRRGWALVDTALVFLLAYVFVQVRDSTRYEQSYRRRTDSGMTTNKEE